MLERGAEKRRLNVRRKGKGTERERQRGVTGSITHKCHFPLFLLTHSPLTTSTTNGTLALPTFKAKLQIKNEKKNERRREAERWRPSRCLDGLRKRER